MKTGSTQYILDSLPEVQQPSKQSVSFNDVLKNVRGLAAEPASMGQFDLLRGDDGDSSSTQGDATAMSLQPSEEMMNGQFAKLLKALSQIITRQLIATHMLTMMSRGIETGVSANMLLRYTRMLDNQLARLDKQIKTMLPGNAAQKSSQQPGPRGEIRKAWQNAQSLSLFLRASLGGSKSNKKDEDDDLDYRPGFNPTPKPGGM